MQARLLCLLCVLCLLCLLSTCLQRRRWLSGGLCVIGLVLHVPIQGLQLPLLLVLWRLYLLLLLLLQRRHGRRRDAGAAGQGARDGSALLLICRMPASLPARPLII